MTPLIAPALIERKRAKARARTLLAKLESLDDLCGGLGVRAGERFLLDGILYDVVFFATEVKQYAETELARRGGAPDGGTTERGQAVDTRVGADHEPFGDRVVGG